MENLKDLKMRKFLAETLIEKLQEYKDDDRFEDALAHYKAQLAGIEGRIKKLEQETKQPVVIGLRTADLLARK